MPRLFPSYNAEILAIQSWRERERQVDSIVQSVTPQAANLMSQYGRYFPTTPPGIVRSLSQAGIEPSHPIAQFALTQQQVRNVLERGSWHGDVSRRRQPSTPVAQLAAGQPRDPISTSIRAAQAAGLVNEEGILVEPENRKAQDFEGEQSDESRAFNRVLTAFEQTGQDLPYINNAGRPVNFLFSRSPEQRAESGQFEYLDEAEQPREPGGGLFAGAGLDISLPGAEAFQETATTTDPIQMQRLEQAGIPLDPTNPLAPLAPVVRPAFMAFDAPIQEIQGQVRNIYAATHGYSPDWFEPQSDLGVALTGDFSPTDAGNGFFVDPESAIARERRNRESERGQIGGHNVTLGRWVASGLTEPDTTPFRIMSGLVDGVAQVADPTAFGLGKVGDIGTARRLFQPTDIQAGIFRGPRNFFHGPTAQRFLDKNIPLINFLARTPDPYDIARATNFKLDPQLTNALASVRDTRDVRAIITSAVERGQIRSTTDLTGTYTQRIVNSWPDTIRTLNPTHPPRAARIFQQVPQSSLDLDNPRQIATNLRNVLHNAHAPEEDIRAVYNQVARSTSRTSTFNAVLDAQDKVGNMLRHYGITDDEAINNLIKIQRETHTDHLSGLYDDIGSDHPTWTHLNSNGEPFEVSGPHLPSEYISRTANIPNIREVRRLTSKYRFLTAKHSAESFGQARLPLALMDGITSNILKPMWLMRLAWPVRVIGEEQIRMATAGLDSAFSGHPLSWLSFVVGSKQTRLTKMMDALPGLKPQGRFTLSGLMFDELDDFQKGVFNTHRAWLDRNGSIPIPHRVLYNRTIPDELGDFRHAWADEISMLYHDPISNYTATHTLDETVKWLWRGQGKKWRGEMSAAHPNNLRTREEVQEYIQTVSDRIHKVSGGDTEVLQAIQNGTFNPASPTSITKGATNQVNGDFTKWLTTHIDSAPTKLAGNAWSRRSLKANIGSGWDQTLDRMYGALMGYPTAKLSRAPAFKQFYWNRAAELIPYAEPEAQARILANAGKSGLPNRTIKNLERRAVMRSGKLNLVEMEDLTKGYALDDTKGLLYDISEKGQASDILRNVVPFAEAWREVLTRWGQLSIRRAGKPIRRAQQIVQGARGEEFGEVMGAPEDKGFFHKNEFGEEVFAYPGSQWLMNHETNIPISPFNLPGMPVPLTGRVQGLNMFGSILPGLGPTAQIPIAWFLQDKPQYDWWRKQLLPFGGPGAEEAASVTDLQDYMPTYMKTAFDFFFEGGRDDRVYNSSVMYVASYLYSTGDYGNTVDEQQRLMEDARNKTGDVFAIRALGQFILPASPAPSWLIQDKDGRLLSQRILAQDFYDILDNSQDYQEATEHFLEKYGTEAISAIIPHSSAVIPNVPTSIEAATWVADHPNIKQQFPLTYGLFTPEGEFDMTTYVRNFYTNERDDLTPEQWAALRDNTLANYWYENQKRQLGPDADSPSNDQARWLRQERERIQETFPYWGDNTGRDEHPTNDVLIRELYRAQEDPTIQSTNAGRALTLYLQSRDQAVEQSRQWSDTGNPTSFRSAQGLASTREWLRGQAAGLLDLYPEFRPLWDYVFDRELQVED